jgi:hypothetical protein
VIKLWTSCWRVSAGRVARQVSYAVRESLGKSLDESLEELLPMSNLLRPIVIYIIVCYKYLAAMFFKVHPELDPLGIDLRNCTVSRGTKE